MGEILGSGVDIIKDFGLFIFRLLDAANDFLGITKPGAGK
jgi:hypothetical protein